MGLWKGGGGVVGWPAATAAAGFIGVDDSEAWTRQAPQALLLALMLLVVAVYFLRFSFHCYCCCCCQIITTTKKCLI